MFLKIVVPEVWAGPIPNNSPRPLASIIFSIPGYLKIAFSSEAKIKELLKNV